MNLSAKLGQPQSAQLAGIIRRCASARRPDLIRQHQSEALASALALLIERHPGASRYVVDSNEDYHTVWCTGRRGLPRHLPAYPPADRAINLLSEALIQLRGDTGSFLMAAAGAAVREDWPVVREYVRRSTEECGTNGYAAAILLWEAMREQAVGSIDAARSIYKQLCTNPIASVRRTSQSAAVLLAADCGDLDGASWFLARMADEHIAHLQTVFGRIARIRANRLGAHRTRESLATLERLSDTATLDGLWNALPHSG